MNNGNKPGLEEVFKVSGIPTYTFVKPKRYPELILNLRTPGRCLVVEGPSGIGKTTAVEKAIEAQHIVEKTTKLSARKKRDVEYIEALPDLSDVGIVVVDDYHRLPENIKSNLADHLKTLADSEDKKTKIIILGINRAGDSLIQFASDLVNRLDVIRFETEPDEKIESLLHKGQDALNIKLNVTDEIISAANGSFYLTQLLAREVCLTTNILEYQERKIQTNVSFEAIRSAVWDRLGKAYRKRTEAFCRGTKLRPEGRAPYLHILNWLTVGDSWTIDLRDAIRKNPRLRGSVSQVVDKGFLRELVKYNKEIRDVIFFDETSELLTIEDPQYLFYLRGIPWRKFARDIGFVSVKFVRRYDFALSFAGSDRDVAEQLFDELSSNEIEVFYDKNEQHRILSEDIEEYLRPIYQSEARFVIVLLGPDYPERIWAKIESESFKERMDDGDVIPIWFSNAPPSMFDTTQKRGGLTFDRKKRMKAQISALAGVLIKKLAESRLVEEDKS